MATQIIEITAASDKGALFFNVPLEGQTYLYEFQFNSREGFWYFDVSKDGTKLKTGVKVVSNWPSLLRAAELDVPPGEILFVDTRTETTGRPGLDDLGTTILMTYVEQADVPV